MNGILFLFITLCTVFLASSISNLITSTGALDYFSEVTQLSDYLLFTTEDELTSWLENHEHVEQFEVQELINLGNQFLYASTASGRTRMLASGEGLGNDMVFARVPEQLLTPLNADNEPNVEIAQGHVALTFGEARHHNISIGDELQLEVQGRTYTFEVTQFVKDMAFIPRIFLSDEDFSHLSQTLNASFYTYAVNVNDSNAFNASLNRAMFASLNTRADQDMFLNAYTVDLMMMAILILVGVILIVISFVVLRFSILFTLQEDYKEIGIMKAVGIKDSVVKRIYLLKYLFLALLGAGLGFGLSAPFGHFITADLREKIAFPEGESIVLVRLLSAGLVVVLILIFCLISTGKLKKLTAMNAIRSGETGQRFKQKNVMILHNKKRLSAVLYLALNDLLSNGKSYVNLLFVFMLGFIGIVMPLNASNTLAPASFAGLINVPVTDVFLTYETFDVAFFDGSADDFRAEFSSIVQYFENHDLDIMWQSTIVFSGFAYGTDIDAGMPIPGITQRVASDATSLAPLKMVRGVTPILDNEIAVTENILTRLNLEVGDEINLVAGGESQAFLITGTYETLIYFGTGIYLSEAVRLPEAARFNIFTVQGDFANRDGVEEQMERLIEISGSARLKDVELFIEENMMDVSIVDTISDLILVVILLVNVLIITLMSLTFMLRDLKQIALLKSLGFSNRAIRLWQGLRIFIVMMVAIIFGGLLVPFANMLASIPFGIMGTPSLTLSMNIVEVYLLYPLLILGVCVLTLIVTTAGIKKIGLTDLGQAD